MNRQIVGTERYMGVSLRPGERMIAIEPQGTQMYLPEHFAEHRLDSQLRFIHGAPLGTLVVSTESGLEANHIPFAHRNGVGEYGALCAHLPRANPLTTLLQDGTPALVIFHGPQGYVSPAWYATKAEHGRVVPTWNYAVVHAHGRARLIEDAGWVRAQLDELTGQMEACRSPRWSVSDAPAVFTEKLIGSLVGLEVRIDRLEGKVKASQNQPAANRRSILAALKTEQPDTAFSTFMHSVIDGDDG